MLKELFIILFLSFFIFSQTAAAQEYVYKINGQNKVGTMATEKNLTAAEMQRLKQDKNLEIIEPNSARKAFSGIADKYYAQQWYLSDINIEKAWGLEKGRKKIIIAVLDTGIDLDHPELINNVWNNNDEIPDNQIDDDHNGFIDDVHGWDFVNNNNNPAPDLTGEYDQTMIVHGTHVAGIIAAEQNNIGISGVCPQCTIMPLQVLNDQGEGESDKVYQAVEYAIANGASLLNLSFGGYKYNATEAQAIKDALSNHLVVVAAVGNDEKNLNKKPIYPACQEKVLGVAAVNKKNQPASFTNFGSNCIDISAPGTNILSTVYQNKDMGLNKAYGYLEGTSMSAPMVAGLVGLLKSYNSDLSRQQIFKYIQNNSTDYNLGDKMGIGVVNAYASLKALKNNDK